jgi:hypothetical protein
MVKLQNEKLCKVDEGYDFTRVQIMVIIVAIRNISESQNFKYSSIINHRETACLISW